MELDIWVIEGLLTMAAAGLIGCIVAWFISQFNKDE